VIAVTDSSPLVILAKLGCFDSLKQIFPSLIISTEVHREVVVDGAGLPGASEVAQASWIEVKGLASPASLLEAQQKYPLGAGELITILLGKELRADAVLLDDHKARKLARDEGLPVRGSVGVLETLYLRGHLADLRRAFQQLVAENVYIDQRLLNHRPGRLVFL
jgi:hypothetical protein